MLTVSAEHPVEAYRLYSTPFAVIEEGDRHNQFRVGGDKANGYYAIAPGFGCGRTCRTPADAIRDLLQANGCTAVAIYHV